MPLAFPRSLKARLSLLTLSILLSGLLALGGYVAVVLRADLQALLSAQQYATAELLADELDRQVAQRMQALEQVAQLGGSRAMRSDVAAQQLLADLPVFQSLFNGGTFITDTRGVAIASMPLTMPRTGLSYLDRQEVHEVLATGKPAIGAPVLSRTLQEPVLAMAVPMRDAGGQVLGVLVGVTRLNGLSFLDSMRDKLGERTGDYLLVSARDRQIITATQTERILEKLPAPGASPTVDRYIGGEEGSDIVVNLKGVEVLVSVKQLDRAPWYVAVSLPTAKAFAPADALEAQALAAIALLALLASGLSGWVIRRQLSPLSQAAQALAEASASPQAVQLPVRSQDEIGQLITAFNALLQQRDRQGQELRKSELLYSTAFQTSPDSLTITRLDDGCYLKVNESFTRIFGWPAQEVVGKSVAEIGIWRRFSDRLSLLQVLQARGRCEDFECELLTRDGRTVPVQVSGAVIDIDGHPCFLAVTRDVSSRQAAQAQIDKLAFSDPITGLPNRRLFMDRLNQAVSDGMRRGTRGALYFIDLDDFKTVNDNLGHDRGDQLLSAVGQRLVALVSPGDTVARLGGDEFVVLTKELPADAALATVQARILGERILSALSQDLPLAGQPHHGSASLGLTIYGPGNDQPLELLKQADMAMYQAKASGRNRMVPYSPDLQDSLSSRAQLEAQLRSALQEGQLQVHYQPQADADGRIVGVEALVRWAHPQRGWITPNEFIPLAEQTGLILPLGRWVLQTACRQLAAWRSDARLSQLTVSVNVSSRQFQQPDFVPQVLAVLADTGAEPGRLRLELTESLLVEHIESVAAKMQQLREAGLGFSLDDFGTGFSSLTYLKSLPLDELKIDRSFIRDIESDPNDLAIARTVVALGQSLGLEVIAEGVETEGQRQALSSIGCQRWQGYLFGRAMPAAEIEQLLRQDASALRPA